MSALQRVPVGFLELLGIKAAGQSIAQAAEFLQPTIDMLDFYGSILWGGQIAQAAAVPAPATATLTVPTNEIWFLKAVGLITNVPAGTTRLHTRLTVVPIQAGGLDVAHGDREFTASANVLTFHTQWQPPTPWILRPGSSIRGDVAEIEPAANVDLNFVRAGFYRVPI